MLIDDLDRHLGAAGSIERAAVPLGMYLAWCGNLHLLAAGFLERHEQAVTRLRFRDLSPAEFLTTCTSGCIDAAFLNEEGRSFSEAYYPHYLEDFASVFGGDPYAVRDDWAHYDQIAAVLTRHFMAWKQGGRRGRSARQGSGRRKWWQVWRG